MKVAKQEQKLPSEAAESLSLEIFKTQLDLVLSTALADPAVSKGLDPFLPQLPCDSVISPLHYLH